MMLSPLFFEFERSLLGRLPPPAFRALTQQIWDEFEPWVWRDLIHAGPIAIEGDSYQPHPEGEWAFLTPVLHIDGETWRKHVWGGCCDEDEARFWFTEVVDIVAWHPATPGRWAQRTGHADMLGEVMPGEAVRVHQTPLGWLRAGGEGICFLHRSPAVMAMALAIADRVIAENGSHARELRDICARPHPIPKIVTA